MQALAAATLAATVLFNPLLAIVNGHVHRLSGGVIAASQAAIVLGGLAIGATARPAPLRWLALAWALCIAFVAMALGRGAVIPKNLGDVLVIPAFICLGARMEERVLARTVTALLVAVCGCGLWELMSPASFGAVFKVMDYYVATRGFDPKQFYAGGDLFVSSERGGGRFLMAFTGWHRGSSLFLEPVSLGNWAGVVALFAAAFWGRMGLRGRAFYVASVAIVLVTCDGRLALGTCVLLALWLPIAGRLPARLAALYLPAMIVALVLARAAGALPQSGDTLSGRFRGGIDLLTGLDMAQMFGIGAQTEGAVDAGWAYLIQGQSIFVGLALWLIVTLSDTGEDAAARRMKHGAALFIVLCLPISYAVLSVKTSALLWATYGVFFQAAARERNARRPFAAQHTAAVPVR